MERTLWFRTTHELLIPLYERRLGAKLSDDEAPEAATRLVQLVALVQLEPAQASSGKTDYVLSDEGRRRQRLVDGNGRG